MRVKPTPQTIFEYPHYRSILNLLIEYPDGLQPRHLRYALCKNNDKDKFNKKTYLNLQNFFKDRLNYLVKGKFIVEGCLKSKNVFKEEGYIRLYQSGLSVAINKPELFIKNGSQNNELLKDLIKGFATELHENENLHFNGTFGTSLASMVLEVVSNNARTLTRFNEDNAWKNIALEAFKHLTSTLSAIVDKALSIILTQHSSPLTILLVMS